MSSVTAQSPADSGGEAAAVLDAEMIRLPLQSKFLTKIYRLNGAVWDDIGTGNLFIYHTMTPPPSAQPPSAPVEWISVPRLSRTHADTVVAAEPLVFEVVSDVNEQQVLIRHRVDAGVFYERQGDTILTWSEPPDREFAVSFQNIDGCNLVWDQLLQAMHKSDDDELLAGSESVDPDTGASSDAAASLPMPDASNLEEIRNRIRSATYLTREILLSNITRPGFVAKLYDLFNTAEDLEEIPALHVLFDIFVSLILINDGAVFEIILSDATIMKTIACLEYDPDLPADNPDRHRHRNFLARSSFRQVIPIRDPQLRGRIQQNFHIGYLKDAVLLRQLDDTTMASLNQTIYFNSMHIVTKLSEDADFLRDLFTTMLQLPTMSPDGGALDPAATWAPRREAFMFLQELCTLAKNLPPMARQSFYQSLVEHSLFSVIELALVSSSPARSAQRWLWLIVADVLTATLQFDPALLRGYIFARINDTDRDGINSSGVLSSVVMIVTTRDPEIDTGLMQQYAEILRLLLDGESMQVSDRETFLRLVFDRHLPAFVDVLNRDAPLSSQDLQKRVTASNPSYRFSSAELSKLHRTAAAVAAVDRAAKFHSCEILTTMLVEHSLTLKTYFVRQNLLDAVLQLLKPVPSLADIPRFATSASSTLMSTSPLQLCATRFIRACVNLQDEFFARRVSSHPQALDNLFALFFANGARYNMFNSAVIEIVNIVLQKNIKWFISTLCTKFADRFSTIGYVEVFQQLLRKHEQNLDSSAHPDTPLVSQPATTSPLPERIHDNAKRFGLEDSHDSYFSSVGDEDNAPEMKSPTRSSMSHSPTHSFSGRTSPPSSIHLPLSPSHGLSPTFSPTGVRPLSPTSTRAMTSPKQQRSPSWSPIAASTDEAPEFIDRLSYLGRGAHDDDDDDLLSKLARKTTPSVPGVMLGNKPRTSMQPQLLSLKRPSTASTSSSNVVSFLAQTSSHSSHGGPPALRAPVAQLSPRASVAQLVDYRDDEDDNNHSIHPAPTLNAIAGSLGRSSARNIARIDPQRSPSPPPPSPSPGVFANATSDADLDALIADEQAAKRRKVADE